MYIRIWLILREFTEVLKVLQDQAPALGIEEMRIVFESDFNIKIEDVFKEFDPVAIAAASLA